MLSLCSASPAVAQDSAALDKQDASDTIIVTGTRRTERTVSDSTSPIDVVSQAALRSNPSVDLNDKLMTTVPSFNAQRLPTVDGASFVRPVSLRALSADQTLLLVDGKRRHRSAYVDITPQRGAQAQDLSQIPEIAVQRVEVLRDGASAQYGSDAIAGVVNVILADRVGLAASAQAGQYYEGDGFNYVLSGRYGMKLGEGGVLTLSGEWASLDPTNRAELPMRVGLPRSDRARLFYNLHAQIAPGVGVYSFGNYGYTLDHIWFSHRSPESYRRSTLQSGPAAIFPDFDLTQVYPDGFTPRFGSLAHDASGVVGLKGDLSDKLTWDVSARYGLNRIRYTLTDSINPTMGPDSPRAFHPGSQEQTEAAFNADFVYSLDAGLVDPVNIAFGGEYRREAFQLIAGDRASYETGPLRDLVPGSLSYPGVTPAQAGKWGRWSNAQYLDVDADISRGLNVSAAVRQEHFDGVGSTTNYKLASRWKPMPFLALRGTISTGFRAPTPGQANITATSQSPDPLRPLVQLTKALIPPTDPVAVAFGGGTLKPERSRNYSVGFVANAGKLLTLSVDAYRIVIRDRIGMLPSTPLTQQQRETLVSSGISSAASLDEYRFFINGFKTRTQGIDVVASLNTPIDTGSMNLTMAYNYNETKIIKSDARFQTLDVTQFYENHLPHHTGVITATYDISRWSLLLRGRYYSGWIDNVFSAGLATLNQNVKAEGFLDAAITYKTSGRTSLSVGAQNILDNYPPRTGAILHGIGIPYPINRPYEADGGQVYVRFNVGF
jgi:iron complex outermembrane recepter protein